MDVRCVALTRRCRLVRALTQPPRPRCSSNADADANVVLAGDVNAQVTAMRAGLGGKADAIVCAAGGWAGGNAGAPALAASLSSMSAMCLTPIFTTAALASSHLSAGGTVVLTGSAAALAPTPGMLAYGAVKAATHHVARSLAAPGSGLPEPSRVLCVCPMTIDTPSNRQWMVVGTDTGAWTHPSVIAGEVADWCEGGAGAAGLPPSGTLMEVSTAGGKSTWAPR